MSTYGDQDGIKSRATFDYAMLGFANEADYNSFVDRLNEQISGLVNRYCRRDFDKHTDDTALIDGNNRGSIRLPGYPVISTTSVKVNGTLLDSTEYRIKKTPLAPDPNSGILERKYSVWPVGWETVDVVYTWGYDPVPPEVVNVVEDIVVTILKDMATRHEGEGADSVSMDGFSTSYKVSAEKLAVTSGGIATGAYAPILERLTGFRRIIGV